MFPKTLLEIVQCPLCMNNLLGSSLRIEADLITDGDLLCKSCLCTFPVKDSVADMSVDLTMNYPKLRITEWQSKLSIHERWWRSERRQPVKPEPLETSWRPSASFIKKYFKLTALHDKGGSVLDLGCGEGQRRRHFSCITYIGIDPLVLRETYPFPFLKAMGEHLPFSDCVFDIVTSIEVFDHLLDPERTVKEILRVLKAGGNLLVFVGDSGDNNSDLRGQKRKSHFSISEVDVHLHRFTENDYANLLRDSFRVLEVEKENGYLSVWGWGKK